MVKVIFFSILSLAAAISASAHAFPVVSEGNETAAKLGLKTVVIDAGHGGKDPGGVSKDKKTYEKNLTLDFARRLGRKITERHPDVKVIYTRTTDVYVTLNERAAIANRNNADLFISIHTNANNSPSVHGASVHILGQSRDPKRDLYASNMDVCRRENSVMLLEDDYSTAYQGFDPNSPESCIFFNLMQNAFYEQSILFASEVDTHLRRTAFKVSSYTGIHQDPFWLLWKTSMPAVLLELGFISNPDDLRLMSSVSGRDDITDKLLAAFTEFKASYDKSLSLSTSASSQTQPSRQSSQSPSVKQESSQDVAVPQSVADDKVSSDVMYAVQIMGLGRKLASDNPAFKGLTAVAVKSQDSNIYKYMVYMSPDRQVPASKLASVRKKFPEAFLVKVVGDKVTRQ